MTDKKTGMSKESRKAPIMMVVLAFAIVYIVWGSTYFFIQVAVQQIPPMMIGAFRFIIAGALLLGWCIITKEGIGSPQQIRIAAVTGMLMLLGGTGAVIWAEKWLPSSLVAILLGVVFAGEHMSLLQVFGFVIILGSVLLINTAR